MSGFITLLFILLFTIQAIIAIYMLIPPTFTFLYFIRKMLRMKNPGEKLSVVTDKQFEFGIIITAHEQTEFIKPLIDSILKQSYSNFYVYIVADACDISGLHFDNPKINVLRPETPLNAKIKSIDYAINQFKREHDAMIILDADNLIHPDFLNVMNDYFRKGYKAVQADFKAKNTDSAYARMDAIGDMFNFFVEREMRMELGLSAAIWGSGIAIDLKLYKEVIYHNFLGGFDKKLQAHLVQRVPLIAFAREAVLYDEKISSGTSLQTQRTRWINAQFKYFKLGLNIFLKGIAKGNFNQAYFAFITIRPPMFLIVSFAIACTIGNFFIDPILSYAWLMIMALFILSFIVIIDIKSTDKRMIRTVFLMPLFMLRQTFALLKMGQANKSFLKTRHSKVIFIDEVLKNQPV